MKEYTPQDKWLNRIIKMLRKQKDVNVCELETGEFLIEIFHNGECYKHTFTTQKISYALQKKQYSDLRNTLLSTGIKEGTVYTPPPPIKRGSTPEIQKARFNTRKEFEAWQNIFKNIRTAERELEANFELEQMIDYY